MTRHDEPAEGGDVAVEAVAAAIIMHEHPTENALTRPEDPLVMVRSDPGFFVCRDALNLARALLASDALRDLIVGGEQRGREDNAEHGGGVEDE